MYLMDVSKEHLLISDVSYILSIEIGKNNELRLKNNSNCKLFIQNRSRLHLKLLSIQVVRTLFPVQGEK